MGTYGRLVVMVLVAGWIAVGVSIAAVDAREHPIELAQVEAADAEWVLLADSTDAAALEDFLARHPNSRHVQVARARLAALKAAPPVAPKRPVETKPTPPRVITAAVPSAPTLRSEQPHVGLVDLNGLRLDWCLTWGRDCGKPAADAFCKEQGYAAAQSFEKQATTGMTWLPVDRQICSGDACSVLANVVCERPVAAPSHLTQDTIAQPQINRMPVSECLGAGEGCGKPVADRFCHAAGFARALRFDRSPPGVLSFHLGTHSVCSGRDCRALIGLDCSR